MTTNFLAVADSNRREFNSMAKWHVKHRPEAEESRVFFNPTQGRDVLPPMGASSSHQRLNAHSATTSRSRAMALAQLQREEASKKCAATPTPLVDSERNPDPSSSSGKRVAHIRRKHRGDCPKHLMHEIQRCGAVYAPDEVPAEKAGDPQPRELPIPNLVGKGLGEFLTGVSNPYYDAQNRVHRPTREHPNFTEHNKQLDEKVVRESATFAAHRVHQRAPDWFLENRLVVDESNAAKKHNRTKYEMKAHMEAVRMMGKALLREFSGAAFK